MKFTDTFLNSLKPNGKRQQFYEPNGFGVIVAPGGAKTFYYRYMLDKKARRLKLGNYPRLTLAKARMAHAEAVDKVQDARDHKGIDPSLAKAHKVEKLIADPTIEQLAEMWLEDKRSLGVTKGAKGGDYERTLKVDVIPAIGALKVQAVKRAHIYAILDAKKKTAPGQAREILKVLRGMFTFACDRDEELRNPCLGVKQPAPYVPTERALSSAELSSLMKVLPTLRLADTLKLLIEFMLLTLTRQGEARGAKWSEINLDEKLWTIPAARIKTRKTANRAFLVPLSDRATELLNVAREYRVQSGAIFASPITGEAYGTWSLDHALRAHKETFAALSVEPFTPHDLRRTGATRLGELGVAPHILDRLLNHADKTTTGRIYNVYEYLEEKRNALTLWAERLKKLY